MPDKSQAMELTGQPVCAEVEVENCGLTLKLYPPDPDMTAAEFAAWIRDYVRDFEEGWGR